jgi:hypothetical protein
MWLSHTLSWCGCTTGLPHSHMLLFVIKPRAQQGASPLSSWSGLYPLLSHALVQALRLASILMANSSDTTGWGGGRGSGKRKQGPCVTFLIGMKNAHPLEAVRPCQVGKEFVCQHVCNRHRGSTSAAAAQSSWHHARLLHYIQAGCATGSAANTATLCCCTPLWLHPVPPSPA